jgi:hypothetical protein
MDQGEAPEALSLLERALGTRVYVADQSHAAALRSALLGASVPSASGAARHSD